MTKLEKQWLKKVKDNPNLYQITVDNDSIWVDDIGENECVFEFNEFGQEFIIELLNELGYNAEGC